jgi:predicted GNAT family N-acyltransferase
MPTEIDVQTCPVELSKPEKLNKFHDFTEFECGESSINDYLHKDARKAQDHKHAVVYVSCFAGTNRVAGYYTLSNGSVARQHVIPKSYQRNSPSAHPVTILGRMGVTMAAQGYGYSVDLLQDAIRRCMIASESVGTSAILVHPLDDKLAEFYAKHAGFQRCPDLSPLTMMLSLR